MKFPGRYAGSYNCAVVAPIVQRVFSMWNVLAPWLLRRTIIRASPGSNLVLQERTLREFKLSNSLSFVNE